MGEEEKHTDKEVITKWFSSIGRNSKPLYRGRFNNFLNFHNLTADQLLDVAKNDGIEAKTLLNEWYNNLEDSGYANKYCRLSEAVVKSFLSYFDIRVKTPSRSTSRRYKRIRLKSSHIQKMVNNAPHIRDRLMICWAMQSGMSISDILSLNIGDIRHILESDVRIAIVEYTRGKTDTESKTCIGLDTIKLLKQYIGQRDRFSHDLHDNSPLFIGTHKLGIVTQKRLSIRSAQRMVRLTAVRAGIISEEKLKQYTNFNPCGWHSIRTFFCSVAKAKGLPDIQVEMALGHKLNYDGAYDILLDEELIENYAKVEKYLSISNLNVSEFDEEKKDEIEVLREEVRTLKETLNVVLQQLKG